METACHLIAKIQSSSTKQTVKRGKFLSTHPEIEYGGHLASIAKFSAN
jgi:hypothetical protein